MGDAVDFLSESASEIYNMPLSGKCILLSLVSFFPALGLVFAGQPVTSLRNVYDAKSLAAKTPEEFKALKQKALYYARANLIVRLLPIVMPVGLNYLVKEDAETAEDKAFRYGLSGIAATTVLLANIPTIKSYMKYLRHVKYAEQMFAILQSPEFKQANGLSPDDDWSAVADALAGAETEAFKHHRSLAFGTKSTLSTLERVATGFDKVQDNLDKALTAALKGAAKPAQRLSRVKK